MAPSTPILLPSRLRVVITALTFSASAIALAPSSSMLLTPLAIQLGLKPLAIQLGLRLVAPHAREHDALLRADLGEHRGRLNIQAVLEQAAVLQRRGLQQSRGKRSSILCIELVLAQVERPQLAGIGDHSRQHTPHRRPVAAELPREVERVARHPGRAQQPTTEAVARNLGAELHRVRPPRGPLPRRRARELDALVAERDRSKVLLEREV
ncbi:hypothetical protein Ctob_016081 [Chrysochromulina tobinii]|uniref:Uncharacterized protein n=1 Tax=Chrysochromulina tobinii TaxID=1460289 RepID=A0A0M0K6I5_9EUKA|nr:hypothetical protein Ctob_016081 [Chrysochromulina tobinii]|eukprot:KOO34419.1 hypothetical protein Ctob_016081 [Chrysochromulina sp. CCMP291]